MITKFNDLFLMWWSILTLNCLVLSILYIRSIESHEMNFPGSRIIAENLREASVSWKCNKFSEISDRNSNEPTYIILFLILLYVPLANVSKLNKLDFVGVSILIIWWHFPCWHWLQTIRTLLRIIRCTFQTGKSSSVYMMWIRFVTFNQPFAKPFLSDHIESSESNWTQWKINEVKFLSFATNFWQMTWWRLINLINWSFFRMAFEKYPVISGFSVQFILIFL